MKKIIYTTTILCFTLITSAQISVILNGKKVTAGQEYNYSDLKSLTVSFANQQKLPVYSNGYLMLYCIVLDKNKKKLASVTKTVEGYASINAFLNAKTIKEYVLMPSKEIGDFVVSSYDKHQFSDICEKIKSDPNGEKVTVEMGLEFSELLEANYRGDKKFGENIVLLEPLAFTLNVADKNATINCSSLNAKFSLRDVINMGYQKFDSTDSWYEVRDFVKSGKPKLKKTTFKFKDYYFDMANLEYNNNLSQEENFKTFRNECDNSAKIIANECYKSGYSINSKRKDELLNFGYHKFFGLDKSKGARYIDKFDKKVNKNYENETLWEPFTGSNVSGFKSAFILKHNSGCNGVMEDYGGNITYIFKNPNNNKAIVVVTWDSDVAMSNDKLKEMSKKIEAFISVLDFK